MKRLALYCSLALQCSLLFSAGLSAMQATDVAEDDWQSVLAENPFIKRTPTGYYGILETIDCTKLQVVSSGPATAYIGLLSDNTVFVDLHDDGKKFYFISSRTHKNQLQLSIAEEKQKFEPSFTFGGKTFSRCTITATEPLTVTIYNWRQRGSEVEVSEVGFHSIKQPYSQNPRLAALLFAWDAMVAMLESEDADQAIE